MGINHEYAEHAIDRALRDFGLWNYLVDDGQ